MGDDNDNVFLSILIYVACLLPYLLVVGVNFTFLPAKYEVFPALVVSGMIFVWLQSRHQEEERLLLITSVVTFISYFVLFFAMYTDEDDSWTSGRHRVEYYCTHTLCCGLWINQVLAQYAENKQYSTTN